MEAYRSSAVNPMTLMKLEEDIFLQGVVYRCAVSGSSKGPQNGCFQTSLMFCFTAPLIDLRSDRKEQ